MNELKRRMAEVLMEHVGGEIDYMAYDKINNAVDAVMQLLVTRPLLEVLSALSEEAIRRNARDPGKNLGGS